MNRNRIVWMALSISAFLMAGCGIHYSVKGRVVDASTKQPVEGAVVAVKWIRYKLSPPGLPSNKERYGTSETVTDEVGRFNIPKYTIGEHVMGVYKKGYVCWSSETIFNPVGKTREEMFVKRRGHKVKSAMVIELHPITANELSVEHASFTENVSTYLGSSPLFDKAIKDLDKVNMERAQEQRKGMLRQKKMRERNK